MTNLTPPSASADNEQEDELREAIIHKLGLERTLQEQLIPSNMEDFMSDWSFTVDDILSLIARHTKEAVEAELETLDERLQYHIDESVKTEKRADKPWEKGGFPLLAESTRAGRLGWVQAQRLVKERIAELSAPQQSSSPGGDRKEGDD